VLEGNQLLLGGRTVPMNCNRQHSDRGSNGPGRYIGGMEVRENVPLAPLTTFGIGGPARYFVAVQSEAELREAMQRARDKALPEFVLGGGSNLVVSDAGWPGLVIKMEIGIIRRSREADKDIFSAGAGVDWNEFVASAVESFCAGVECLNGIPGTVGAAPVQNVGAYGQDVSETIVRVRALIRETLEPIEFNNQDCGFSYRTSRFNTHDKDKFTITRVDFALTQGGRPKVEYGDVKKYFAASGQRPTLQSVSEAVWKIRRAKAMVITSDEPDSRSAGSFFKNPIIPSQKFASLAESARSRGAEVPSFPASDGHVKVPAAWLIENSGLHKGFTLGCVGISSKHTLALVNRGGATSAELLALKDLVQKKVYDAFGIELRPEPVFLGFDRDANI
jgi:UDP-N-acetylmuramate dehydrogenase